MTGALTPSIPAFALGAVIAACAAAAWLTRDGRLPSLAAGALSGLAALLAARWSGQPPAVTLPAVAAVTGLVGGLAGALDMFLRRRNEVGRGLDPPVLLHQVAVLGLIVGVAAIAQPPFAVELPVGPLGGTPSLVPALISVALGLVAVSVLTRPGIDALPAAGRWAVAGVLLAVVAVPAAGLLSGQRLDPSNIGVPAAIAAGVADPLGLSLRGLAVALAAGASPARILLWAALLAGSEVALRTVGVGFALLPLAALLALGVATRVRTAGA